MLDIIRFAKDHPSHAFNKRELAGTAKKGKMYFMFPKWKAAWSRLVSLGILKNTTNNKGKIAKTQFCLAIAAQDLIDEKLKNISDSGMDVRGTRTEPEEKPLVSSIHNIPSTVEEFEDEKLDQQVEIYNAQRQVVINELAVIGIQIKKLEKKAEGLYEILNQITA